MNAKKLSFVFILFILSLVCANGFELNVTDTSNDNLINNFGVNISRDDVSWFYSVSSGLYNQSFNLTDGVSLWYLNDTNQAGLVNETNGIKDYFGSNNGILYGKTFNHGTNNGATLQNNLTGTITGATWTYDNELGKDVLSFDGDDYVEINLLKNNYKTICANIKPNTITGTQVFVSDGSNWWIGVQSGNFYINGATATANTNNNYLCLVNDTINTAYLNGVSIGVFSISTKSNILRLGGNFAGGFYANGTISDVIILDKALNSTEVLNLYNTGQVNTTGYYHEINFPLDEGTGSTVYTKDGKFGGYYEFDRATQDSIQPTIDYVEEGIITNAVTMSAWVYPQSNTNGASIGGQFRSASASNDVWGLYQGSAGQYIFRIDNGTIQETAPGSALNTNQWYYITGTYDGTTVCLFYNGEQETCQNVIGGNINNVTNSPFTIGNRVSTLSQVSGFNGSIDEVKIWNRALTQTEIQEEMNSNAVANPEGIVAYYDFNEKTGTTVYDNNHLTTGARQNTADLDDPVFSWDKAMYFDGEDDYVDIDNVQNIISRLNNATISFWINSNDVISQKAVISSALSTSNRFAITQQNGILRAGYWDGTDWKRNSISMEKDSWINYIIVYNVSNFKLYKNLALATGTLDPSSSGLNDFRLGARTDNQQYFNGSIADVRIYDKALSEQEIYSLYSGYEEYNITVNSTGYIDNETFHNLNNNLAISLDPEPLEDFDLTTPSDLEYLYSDELSYAYDGTNALSNLFDNDNTTGTVLTNNLFINYTVYNNELTGDWIIKEDSGGLQYIDISSCDVSDNLELKISTQTNFIFQRKYLYYCKLESGSFSLLYQSPSYEDFPHNIYLTEMRWDVPEKTTNDSYVVSYTESNSPSGKNVTYNISVLYLNETLKESFTTNNLTQNINLTAYNSGTYKIRVRATEDDTDSYFEHYNYLLVDRTNYVYFYDAKTSNPLNNTDINIITTEGRDFDLTTNSFGEISFSSYNNSLLDLGNYSFKLIDKQGFITGSRFIYEANSLPFNISYNISRANLTILVKDTETNALVTNNVTVSITNIGEFEIDSGNLTLVNTSFVSGDYTVYVSSDVYTYNQKEFTFTNQEELIITVFVTDLNASNLGVIYVNVYDSFLDLVSGADLRLQVLDEGSSSFVEEAQRTTSSSGQASFNVLLNENFYRIFASATIDGVTYSGYSSENGELIYLDGQVIEVYLNTVVTSDEGSLYYLDVNVSNTDLIDNVSYHTVNFIDTTGIDHEVCLGYYYLNGVIETQLLEICETASSGSINQVGGYSLNRSYINIVKAYVKEGDYKKYYYSQRYMDENSFENTFEVIIGFLIMSLLLTGLGMALHLNRIDYFSYISIFLGVVWSILTPSFYSGVQLGFIIVLNLAIIYLAKQRSNLENV